MPKAKETVLEIDLSALQHNYSYLKSKLSNTTKFLAVVKAYAYGSEAPKLAAYLQDIGADYFAVAYINEGVALRKAGITKPILVLHPQAVNFKTLIQYNLEPSLYSIKILDAFIATATAKSLKQYPVHLKFNTGLNRLGFNATAINTIIEKTKQTTSIKVSSLFSHLAASEDLNEKAFTLKQIKTFKAIAKKTIHALGFSPMLHMCNTSGILNYPEAHFDMVRSGIGLYGFGNAKEQNKYFKPVATLKTIISQIHTLNKGESLGYNRGYISSLQTKTATLPIGHADGIGRQYGKGKGFVTINGHKAPILGNVCMDMIMVDVTHINCNEGDEVIVFGQTHTAETLALTANTISYELITGISQRVKRVFLK